MLERMKSFFTKAPAKQDGEGLIWNIIGGKSIPKRGSAELVQAYKNTPWLRSVCSRLATDVASVRWQLWRAGSPGPDGKAKKYKALSRARGLERTKMIAKMRKAGELVEVEDHPLLDTLHHGNKMLPGHSAMEVSQLHLDIQGEAFWFLDKGIGGMPFAFWPIPPNWIAQVATPDNPFYMIQYGSSRWPVPAEMMLYFRYPDPGNPYARGTGIAESMGDELDTDEYATEYIKGFFANGGVPDALIGLKGASPDALKAAKLAWDNRYRGTRNAHQVAWHNGEVNLEMLGHTFKDQQVMELRQSVRDTIIQIFGVPPECVGIIENSNRATIDAASYIMAKYVTTPRLERIRDVLQDRMVPMYDDRLVIDFESPIPEDKEFRLKVMQAQPSTITRAEWREAAGLESHGEVDDVYLMGAQAERSITDPELYVGTGGPTQDGEPQEGQDDEEQEPDEEDAELEDDGDEDEEDKSAKPRVSKMRRKADSHDIETTLLALEPEPLATELDPVIRAMVDAWGQKILRELGITGNFEMLNPRVTEHLQALALDRLKAVNDTTKEKLRGALIEGVQAGEGIRELSARVREVFAEADSVRATRIARTEVLRSSNFANWEAQVQAGIVNRRQWVSTNDDRTRDSHRALNGQERGIQEPFEINGNWAMTPGDFGDPAEDINCRCTTIPMIAEPKSADQLGAYWKSYDEGLRPYEKQARRAMRSAFATQRDAVLDMLYDVLS